MVVKQIEMKDALETLNNKTKQIRQNFENCYARGNETIDFKEQFMKKENEIEELFSKAEKEDDIKTVSKILVNIGEELQTLEKLLSVSSMFVTQQVHDMCDDLIWSLEDRLTLLKKIHLANKRVKEAEKPPPTKSNTNNNNINNVKNTNISVNNNNNNNVQNNSNASNKVIANNNVAQPRVQNNTKFITKVRPLKQVNFLNEKVYTLENLNGVALGLTERVINSKRVLLSGLVSCRIKIGSYLESLQIICCKYCKILVGQVNTSIIKNTYNSLISINGDNIRIEYCESTIFKVPVKSNALVKECYNLEFAPYEMDFDKKKNELAASSTTEQMINKYEERQNDKFEENDDSIKNQLTSPDKQLTEYTECLAPLNQSYEFVQGGRTSD